MVFFCPLCTINVANKCDILFLEASIPKSNLFLFQLFKIVCYNTVPTTSKTIFHKKGDTKMKITHFQVTSATTLNLEFSTTAPVCFLCGHYSDLALDLMRELIGDCGEQNNPDRVDDGRFVIHADIEMDNKNYNICYIRNADFMGDNRLAVNFEPNSIHFSEDDTREFVDKCNKRDVNTSNVLFKNADITPCDDDRPIFIYDYFDRLDEAIDITPILDRLASLGRQVFVAVCAGYPEIKHVKTEMIKF